METGQEARHDVIRRIQDVSSGQYLDMSADAPTFDLPEGMDPDALVAFLDVGEKRLYFSRRGAGEGFAEKPEVTRLDHRRHDERCLVTTGQSDENGRRIYWVCRIER